MAAYKDNSAKVIAELERQVEARLMGAAVLLQAEHKRDLSTANPAPHSNPSRPGEFPRARTFNLRDAVAIEKVSRFELRVGYWRAAWYIVPLAVRMRKTVIDTAARIRSRINAILNGR